MKQFTYTIKDALGIHARPAGLLAKKAKSYADTTVTITCEGANEEEAATGLLAFLQENL